MKQQGIYRVCVSSIMAASWAPLRLLGQLFLYKYLISDCVLFWERCHASIFHTMDWSRACIIYFCRRHSWKEWECRRDPTLVKTVWLSRFWSIDAQSGWRVKMICTHWWCDSKKKPLKEGTALVLGVKALCVRDMCLFIGVERPTVYLLFRLSYVRDNSWLAACLSLLGALG